jgi:hypothetical protein
MKANCKCLGCAWGLPNPRDLLESVPPEIALILGPERAVAELMFDMLLDRYDRPDPNLN